MPVDAVASLEPLLESLLKGSGPRNDPAHDLLHLKRVVRMAKVLCAAERAQPEVVVPAAWLHDVLVISKDDPRRSQASRLSARAAVEILQQAGYPERHLEAIAHAIESHSFSAGIAATTVEARVVQDADRLDGLGAIGIARCFSTAGSLGRPFYNEEDPFCASRPPDDGRYTIDHFFQKLFKTAESLQTDAGKGEGRRRVGILRQYLADLQAEL
jgi:uncharacterized protein